MYGFFIALATIVFVHCASTSALAINYLKPEQLSRIAIYCVIIGVIGSRLLYILQYPEEFRSSFEYIAIWEGGLILGGAVVPIIIFLPLYCWYQHIKITVLLDLAGMYGGLLQAIARLGCFCAGCCSGYQTTVPWAVTYTHPDSVAPLDIPIHSTQLYSSLTQLFIFILIRFGLSRVLKKPGQIAGVYLMLSSAERFMNDFWRAEHYAEPRMIYNLFSPNQVLSMGILCAGIITLIIASIIHSEPYRQTTIHESI
jgi:phosphatidylglycerol:prolipoprotein diacylglycerol transferase